MIPIILILGTSTAGKTTLTKSKAFDNFYRTGVDLACHNYEIILETTKVFIKYFFEFDLESSLKKCILSTGIDHDVAAQIIANRIILNSKDLNNESCPLVESFTTDYIKHEDLLLKMLNIAVFEDAAHKALDNKPVILDMVPSYQEYDILERSKEVFNKYGLESTITLVHLGIDELAKRIMVRNEVTEDERIGMFPFMQYTRLFVKTKQHDDTIVSTITPKEITKAIAPLQAKYNIGSGCMHYSDAEVADFLTKLGFTSTDMQRQICLPRGDRFLCRLWWSFITHIYYL